MLIGFYIVLAVLGSLLAMSVVRIVDWAIKVFDPTHRKRSLAEQALVSTGCNVFWISGYSLKAALLWAGCTAVLWPVFVGVYLLVRYRPHWFTIWSAFKAVFAVAISPFILLVFQLDKWAFINIMTALWPHIDIYTPDGKLYLRRWFMTPKGQSYRPRFLHLIMLSDVGRDPHDHPGSFTSDILWNGYDEEIYFPQVTDNPEEIGRPGNPLLRAAREGDHLDNPEGHTHAVKLVGPTLTWVVAWQKGRPWGFWVMDECQPELDVWIESEEYGDKGEERKSWTLTGR
jgi:hypothetical protein